MVAEDSELELTPALTMDSLPDDDDDDDDEMPSFDPNDSDSNALQLDLPSTPKEAEKMLAVLAMIEGATALVCIDTASSIDIISPQFAEHAGLNPYTLPKPSYPIPPQCAWNGTEALSLGKAERAWNEHAACERDKQSTLSPR